jgi:endopolyphosphatase
VVQCRGHTRKAGGHQLKHHVNFSRTFCIDDAATNSRIRYFFSSNSAVDGCANKREPGYEHMEWLRIQLQIFRERGMKAILMGHVPPARVDSKESWDETCWQKYTLWQRQFRDVIVGGLYGHMNIDHFMLQDFDHISKDAEKGRMAASMAMQNSEEEDGISLYEDGEVTVASASDYLLDLRDAWAQLPSPPPKSNRKSRSRTSDDLNGDQESSIWGWLISKIKKQSISKNTDKSEKKKYLDMIGGKFAERYSVTHVAPSVVPNYYPTLRIIEYNITGLENNHLSSSYSNMRGSAATHSQQPIVDNEDEDADYLQDVETAMKKKKNKKGPRKYKFKVPEGPSKSSPPGPAYSPQVFTWTRYTQYFANLTHINNDFVNNTVSVNRNSPKTIFGLNVTEDGQIENLGWKEGKHGKHQGKQPRPEPHPNEFVFEIEYDTKENHKFPDLTVRRWVEYARRIGQQKGGKSTHIDEVDEDTQDASSDVGNQDEISELFSENEFDEDEDQDVVEETGKGRGGKKHKKKKGKKRKHHRASKEWYTFARRAFVGTMNPHDIKQLFSTKPGAENSEGPQEVVEL